MGTSVLHIKTEVECRVFLFDEEKGIAKPGTWFNLEVRKGEQDLLFVSTEDETARYKLSYNIEESDTDYRLIIEEYLIRNIATKPSEEEIAMGIEDEFGVVYSRDGQHLLKCNNKKLKDYVVLDCCKVIRAYAFGGDPFDSFSLSSITLPNSLTHLGENVFAYCNSLSTIILPDSLTYIGDCAFSGCYNLYSVNLPNSLRHVGDGIFADCFKLSFVNLPANLTTIGNNTFRSCRNLLSINLPDNLTRIGSYAFQYCSRLTSINLPSSLKHIGIDAFSGCKSLTVVNLPDGLTCINWDTFSYCEKLHTITFPANLTDIGAHAFCNCSALTRIKLPERLTHIGGGAFLKCVRLTTLTLPSSLTDIEDNSLADCDSLSHIYISAGMRAHFEKILPERFHDKLIEKNKNTIVPPHYLFFDTETTGVPIDYEAPSSDTQNWPRLVQLSWIVTDEVGEVLSQGNKIVKPEGFVIPANATRVHGITTEYAQREGKPLREVIETFLKDAKQTKFIVGHNISFDQKVVGAELYRLGIPDTISNARSICTMKSYSNYCKSIGLTGNKYLKLQELHNLFFGYDYENAHDAMADTHATMRCFFEMRWLGIIKKMVEKPSFNWDLIASCKDAVD